MCANHLAPSVHSVQMCFLISHDCFLRLLFPFDDQSRKTKWFCGGYKPIIEICFDSLFASNLPRPSCSWDSFANKPKNWLFPKFTTSTRLPKMFESAHQRYFVTTSLSSTDSAHGSPLSQSTPSPIPGYFTTIVSMNEQSEGVSPKAVIIFKLNSKFEC